MDRGARSNRPRSTTAPPTTTRNATGRTARSTSATGATRRSLSPRRAIRTTPTRLGAEPGGASAAEPADHVVQDGHAPAQGVDRHPLIDPVDRGEETFVGVEPEGEKAVGRDAERIGELGVG